VYQVFAIDRPAATADSAGRVPKIHFGGHRGGDKICPAATQGWRPMAEQTIARATPQQRGASLVETLMALSIAAVLASAAVPAMRAALVQQRLRSSSVDLYATFHAARSEAIRRAGSVAVTPMDAEDWSKGWRVFADRNDDGVQDAGEATLVERPLAADGLTIRPYFGAMFAGTVLSYNAEGRLHRPGGRGLVLGRLVLTLEGAARSLCFASLGVRIVAAAGCD
jgi:Tfp pilus assembly protein FimT